MTPMRESFESQLPEWVGDTLREPATSTPDARARIMSAVRTLPAPRAMAMPFHPSRWRRRGLLSPTVGLLTSVALAVMVMVRASGDARSADVSAFTTIMGDSVVPLTAAQHDSAGDGRWLDTLRIVEFVLRGPGIREAAVLGEFNHWQRGATPMVASMVSSMEPHDWRARVLVPRDALQTVVRAAYLINNRRIVSPPKQTPM